MKNYKIDVMDDCQDVALTSADCSLPAIERTSPCFLAAWEGPIFFL